MTMEQTRNNRETLCNLSDQERKLIIAYRNGKAEESINLLINQGLLPSSFPMRPGMH